jgi:hypothetical protein
MFQAQKAAANIRRRTSFGRKLEATSDGIQATHALGDITNLIHEASAAYEGGRFRMASSCMTLVKKALPFVQSAVSENIVLACPKGGTSVSYAVSRINKEEKKRKSIESLQKRSSKRCKSDSFIAVQLYVSENKNAAKDKLATTVTKTSLTSPLLNTRLSCAPYTAVDKTPEFSKPANCSLYTPHEVISILNSFDSGTAAKKKRTAVKKAMIEKNLASWPENNGWLQQVPR